MKSLSEIVKAAKNYNAAIDAVLAEHEAGKEAYIYWRYVPKLFSNLVKPGYALNYLKQGIAEGEEYNTLVSNYNYMVAKEIGEIIDGLAEAHRLEKGIKYLTANVIGCQVLTKYITVIHQYWSNLL